MRKIYVRAIRALGQAVFLRDDVGGFFSKKFRLQQIAHPQAAPSHLVFVSGTDSTRSRADFVGAARYFRGSVQFAVIGKNQVGAVADVEPSADIYAGFRKRFNLRHQRPRIHHHTRADHRVLLWPQNSARDELQHETVFPDDDGVPRVVASSDARDEVKRAGEIVDDFALAFITPLRADHHD